jgi:hypothetical protein
LASGPLALRGSRNVFPAGFTFTHTHSGPTFVYVLSGSVEVSAETGTVDHPAGSFFFEPAAHVHTLHVPKGAELISVTLSPPIMATTQAIMRVVPIITAYGPAATSSSFTVSFTSAVSGQGYVLFGPGPGCSGLVETATRDLTAGTTSHSIVVTGNDLPGTVGDIGILPGVTYWYEVLTVTSSGIEHDNNAGRCYSVTVPAA